jgi:hypothetical protein
LHSLNGWLGDSQQDLTANRHRALTKYVKREEILERPLAVDQIVNLRVLSGANGCGYAVLDGAAESRASFKSTIVGAAN